MSRVTFKVVPHPLRPGQEIVEIHLDGGCIGAIYADQNYGRAIKLVSVHMKKTETDPGFAGDVIPDDGSLSYPQIPAVHIEFEVSPWSLDSEGRVVKQKT